MGEQKNPGDSTDFLVPQVKTPVGGWPIGSLGDYFGLPTVGQVGLEANALLPKLYGISVKTSCAFELIPYLL